MKRGIRTSTTKVPVGIAAPGRRVTPGRGTNIALPYVASPQHVDSFVLVSSFKVGCSVAMLTFARHPRHNPPVGPLRAPCLQGTV